MGTMRIHCTNLWVEIDRLVLHTQNLAHSSMNPWKQVTLVGMHCYTLHMQCLFAQIDCVLFVKVGHDFSAIKLEVGTEQI